MSDTPRTDDFLAHRGHDGIEQFTRGLERENAKLKSIVRAAYLHCLDGCTPDGVTVGQRLSKAEQHQLGKDLAIYGCREANDRG